MALIRGKGESAREFKARSTGGKLDYSTGKVSLPKPAPAKMVMPKPVSKQTPAAKLSTAQKSQPIYGPAVPKDFSYKAPTPKPLFSGLNAVKNYKPTMADLTKKKTMEVADPAKPSKEQLDEYTRKDRETVLRNNIPKISDTAKDFVAPSLQGKTLKEVVSDTSGSMKDRVKGIGKGIGKIALSTLSLGASFQKHNPFASDATKRQAEIDQKKIEDKLSGKEGQPGADIQYKNNAERQGGLVTDIAQFPFIGAKTGTLKSGVGRIVTRAGEAGVSPKGISRIIAAGEKGAFQSTPKMASNRFGIKTARAAEGEVAGASDTAPKMTSVPKISSTVDDVPTPRRTTPEGRIEAPVTPVRKLADEQRRFNEPKPRTREEIPKRNTNKTDEVFEEGDEVTGRGKAFVNVDNGRGGLDKVEVGEWDEAGDFIVKNAEDGRPAWKVAEESQDNIRNGKRNTGRSDRPGDARAAIQNMRKPGKKGSLVDGKKLSAGSDAKLAKTAEDANIQDHIKSKIERLKAQLQTAKDPDTYARISRELDDETSIARDYPKMSAEDKQFFKERSYRENPDVAKKTIDDYQGTREDAFKVPKIGALRKRRSFNEPVVAETAPKKGLFGLPKTLKGFVKNPLAKESPLLQEAKKYSTPEEFVKSRKIMYHGTNDTSAASIEKNGFKPSRTFLTPDEGAAFDEFAPGTARRRGGKPSVIAVDVTDANVKYNPEIGAYTVDAGDVSRLKTKSQLTDLWKQAQGGEKKSLRTLPGFIKNPLAKETETGFNPQSYVKEMVKKQRDAEGKTGILANVKGFLGEFKKKIIETNAPIEDVISEAQKKYKFEAIPRYDMTNQIDRLYRAQSMAGQFAKENGLEKVIRGVDDMDEFDQYLIAKHGQSLEREGITTGRDAARDAQLIEAVGQKYAKAEKVVRDYSHKLLDYAVESGLISKKVASDLKVKFPDYVPYQRIFGEDEAVTSGVGRSGVASLGRQSVVQRIKGSEREVQSPMQSFLEKTTDAFVQGEKNKAAQIITSHSNLPGNPFGLEKVTGTKSPGDNTISVFKDGIKETWKVNKDVAEAAKAMNVQQIGLLGKIFAAPIRVAKLGITGINLPFVAANVAKDVVSAFVNSKNSFRALTTMPQALFEALGHQKLWQEMAREGAMQTSFDIARNQVTPTMRNARGLLGNKGMERVKYIADTPAKLFRAVEDIIGRSEEFNRISQYKAAYDASIKKGMLPIDARAVAARAARETTTNFARKGEWGGAMNVLVLYLNAGIQGTRTLTRNITTRPVATGTKIMATVAMPLAITTAWNLKDPERKAAYEDIPEYEKENNFILIPENPTKDENGKWNVIKVPITPGLSNMVQPVRYALERANGLDPQSFAQMANVLSGSVSPVQMPVDADTTRKTLSQLTPQALKPTIEAQNNKDAFTGAPIIPRKLEGLAPELQVKDNTSGTAKVLGGQLNASPLQVEHFIKSNFGSVGLQILNVSDKVLAKTGVISPEDIGGQEVFDAVFARFGKASGNAIQNKQWEMEAEAATEAKSQKNIEKQEFQPTYDRIQKLYKEGKDAEAEKAIEDLTDDEVKQFQKVVTAEKKKITEENKRKMGPVADELSALTKEGNDAEVERIIDSLSDDEVHALELILK